MRRLAFILLLHAASAVVAQTPDSSARTTPRPIRRQPLTPELLRTAFADARARTLLERAREARIAQDSTLRAYDAKTYMRISMGMGFRKIGRQRLLLRTEQAARVRWSRASGIWVEPTGRRAAFPLGGAELDMTAATPIPYFPGRESLWIPSAQMGVAQAEVNENEMLHPLATGAEAYYRYATGDSVSIRLPDGRSIALRELRITARRPEWRAFVGSFWFDIERGNLVRAAYRMAAEMDIWEAAAEDARREGKREDAPPKWIKGMFSPMRANLSAVTVEYGLYEGRFWLPRLNVAEGEAQAGFVRVPMKVEESFRYNSVNGRDSLPAVPTPAEMRATGDDTVWASRGYINIGVPGGRAKAIDTTAAARIAREDSIVRRETRRADSLRADADAARAKGDTARARELTTEAGWHTWRARQITRRREGCARDTTYYAGTISRYGGAVRMGVRMPCDTSRFATSADLPASIYGPDEAIVGAAERDALLGALDFGLQPEWAPQKPVFHTGLDLLRYNRIEALSVGATVTSVLGKGYTAQLVGRIGTGDGVPNGDLSLARSSGRAELRFGAFHRLGVANDDWGAPLSVGASLANLLYARDEGFYYRTWGAELAGARDAPGPLGGATMVWRLFAERQRTAGVDPNTQASLARVFGHAGFAQNIDAVPLTALGAGGELARTFGVDPRGLRFDTRLRGEAAFTDRADSLGSTGYGRVVVDGTLSRSLGGGALAVTGAAGGSAGELPPQRAFYIGGLQTVRGQFARPLGAGRVGDTFWLGRAELGLGQQLALRPALFYDIGWAGRRADFARPGRPLSGVGVGLSLLDGLVRIDLARGIWPERRWRTDIYLEARF